MATIQAKWLSEEALQIAEKKRKERERRKENLYPAEWRVPKNSKRDKKAFLSEQCKKKKKKYIYIEREENNWVGKIRDLFQKTGDTKGTLYSKMSTIKDRNDKVLTEAEEIKKRQQEHTE